MVGFCELNALDRRIDAGSGRRPRTRTNHPIVFDDRVKRA